MSAPVKPLPEGAELLPDGKVRYTLRFPVKYQIGNEETTLESVVVRRKKWADTVAVKNISNIIEEMGTTIQRLTGLETKILDELDDYDAEMIAAVIGSFGTPGPATPSGASA